MALLGCRGSGGGMRAEVVRLHGPVIAPPRATGTATVRAATQANELCPGPNASGRLGDLVLANRYVRAVVEQVPGGAGFALSGGNLLDLSPVVEGVVGDDELGQVFTMTGEFPRQLVFEGTTLHTGPDGAASITMRGHDARHPALHGTTEYRLGGDDHAVTLTTTLENTGDGPVHVLLGDAVQWGGAEHFAPGAGFTLLRSATYAWLGGVGVSVAYAMAATRPLEGTHGGNWSDPTQGERDLAPHERVSFVRRIAVTRGTDLAEAISFAGVAGGEARVVVRVEDPAGQPVSEARVTLVDGDHHPVMMGATHADGRVSLAIAPGRYEAVIDAPGRRAEGLAAAWEMTAGEQSRTVRVSARSSLLVHAWEGDAHVPARVLVTAMAGGRDPNFGPIGRASGARNSVVLGLDGTATLPIAPGRYTVTVTRGPEYSLPTQEVSVGEGETATVDARLVRVVDTRGYACGDFHQHQSPSLDAPLSLRERVRANVAEGLEIAAATDHNTATDLSAAVRDEGLTAMLLTMAGVEVSTDVAARPFGHVNVFPIPVARDEARGGVPDFLDHPVGAFFAEARQWAPGAVIQVNHPRAPGAIGMFETVHLDPTTGRADPDFTPNFHALEVWNGRYQSSVPAVLRDWFALVRGGAEITLTGNSDSHAIVTQEAGWPRTCVAVSDDTPGRIQADEVVRALRETRDVTVYGGPFVRVTDARGRSVIGRSVPTGSPLTVSVVSPRWIVPDRAVMLDEALAETAISMQFVTRGETIEGRATVRAARGMRVFRVTGEGTLPTLVGPPTIHPMTLTNGVRGVDAARAPR